MTDTKNAAERESFERWFVRHRIPNVHWKWTQLAWQAGRAAASDASMSINGQEEWTRDLQDEFCAWLNAHYPNEASAGVVALGDAWLAGRDSGYAKGRAATDKQKPVAWAVFTEDGYIRIWSVNGTDVDAVSKQCGRPVTPLFAAQPSVQVPQWISVSEKMPEDRQEVLFVVDCKNPQYEHLHGRVLGGKYITGQPGYFSVPGLGVNASFWMPSPAAPQGDSK